MSLEHRQCLSSWTMQVKEAQRRAPAQTRFCYLFNDGERVVVHYDGRPNQWLCLSVRETFYLLPMSFGFAFESETAELEDAAVRWCVTGKKTGLVKLEGRYLGVYVAYTLPG